MWGLINTLQMIVIIVLFNVQFPFNCAKILIDVMQLANLDLLNVDEYTADIFNFKVMSKSMSDILMLPALEAFTSRYSWECFSLSSLFQSSCSC